MKDFQMLTQENDRNKDTIEDQNRTIRDLQDQLNDAKRNLDNERDARYVTSANIN